MVCVQGLTFNKVNTFYCLIRIIVKWNWHFKKNPGGHGSAVYTGCYNLVTLPQLVLGAQLFYPFGLCCTNANVSTVKIQITSSSYNELVDSFQRSPESMDSTLRITGIRNAWKVEQRRETGYFFKAATSRIGMMMQSNIIWWNLLLSLFFIEQQEA